MSDVPRDVLADVLDTIDADEPPVLEVAEALAEARNLSVANAQEAVYAALEEGVLEEHGSGFGGVRLAGGGDAGDGDTTAEPADSSAREDETPTPGAPETTIQDGDTSKYRRIYLDAVDRAGREPWEPVEEAALREALDAAGFAELLDEGTLFEVRRWRVVDVSDRGEEPRRRWYYPSEDEPRPAEFRRFDELLREAAPDGYEPHYFRVRRAGKDPATQFGSWKSEDARLTVEEAVEWMNEGGNVGIAGRGGCRTCGGDGLDAGDTCTECDGTGEDPEHDGPLVNVDIDDDEETTPEDVPTSLRARSRSRTGWHTWYFDPDGEVPNIPTDEYGEVRANWQYVVAPGSFVASTAEEIPDDAEDPGYYTVEDEAPVASIGLDDLPEVFRDLLEEIRAQEEAAEEDHDDDEETTTTRGDDKSAVFDVEAADLVTENDPSSRFTSVFHDSSTGANMSVSEGKLHCWRHGVAHGGLQALATLANVEHVRTYGCRELGAEHKHSDAGTNRLKGDWRLVWGAWYEAKKRGAIREDDPVPYRVLRELAVADGLVDRDDLVARGTDTGEVVDDPEDYDGDTYPAFPPGAYADALEHVREEYDLDPGREVPDHSSGEVDTEDDEPLVDPVDAEAVFEPRHAWEAAGAVDPEDLDEPLPELEDAPDVVRAVAIAEDHADDLAEASDLDPTEYFDLYDRARTEYGAPLPVYVDASRTVDDLEATRAAVENLKAWHILDELDSEITVADPGGDAIAKINPTWEESESGERIIAFDSRYFWCAEHDRTFDPLRAVALENGLIQEAEAEQPLGGRTYLDAYDLARTEYGAPLPRVSWLDSEHTPDPDVAVVLPPAEDLVGEFTTDRDGLDAARDEVEDLYRDLAQDTDTDAVLSAEPSTGKSTAAVKSAADEPTLLLAPRKELQAEYVEKSNDPDIVGDTPLEEYILPVFSEPWEGVSREAAEAGVAAVREHPDGFDLLKDGADLRAAVESRLEGDETLEAPAPDDDAVQLGRATDDTAAGEHGLEWALRAETAHALGLQPRTIHERDLELFGEPLPCNHDEAHEDDEHGDTGAVCSYTEAYEYIADPERPIDLLIGSRIHAKVESAKAYHHTRDDRPAKDPRVVAIDEAVVGDYTTKWEENARHVATWLASTLTDAVEDGTDLNRQAHRLRDGWVFPWLRGDGADHLTDLDRRVTIAEALATLAHDDDRHAGADRARELVLEEGAIDTEAAVGALETLLDAPRRDLDEATLQALRHLDSDGALRDAVDDVDTEGGLGEFSAPDLGPGEAFVDAARQPFDLLAEAPEDDPEEYLDRVGAAFDTARGLVEGGADGTRELVVQAREGYAHPQAYLLLAGAIGTGDEPLETHGAPIPGRDDPTRVNQVEVSGASVVYDRNGDGAVVTNPPEFTGGGGDCSVVGLDATPRRELWEQHTGTDLEVVSPFDDLAERRRFVRDTRNLQVVQTDEQHVNTYSGDPTGNSFDEDLELVQEVRERFGGRQLRPDSLASTGDPAVITTKKVEDYLRPALEPKTSALAHFWDVAGRNDLGTNKTGVVLGAPHPGDDTIERAALLAGETVDPEGHGIGKDYNSALANEYLAHAWQDQLTQAVHRFGRDEDGAIVFVHSAAVDDERLPVVGTGGTMTAWSDAGKAVRRASLPYLRTGSTFTIDDILEEVAYGRRAIQQKLAEFEQLGYVDREVGGPGRANVFTVTADPGEHGHVDLEDVDGPEESERSRNAIQYTGPFGLKHDLAPSDPPIPPSEPTLPSPTAARPAPRPASAGEPPG
jgi:hypothetical protein